MSRNDWESGTIKLPTAEFAKVRKACEVHAKTVMESAFEQTQVFWKTLTPKQKRDEREYDSAKFRFIEILRERGMRTMRTEFYDDPTGVAEATESLLYLGETRRPTFGVKRIQRGMAPFPTNRTLTFHPGDGSIIFNKDNSEVRWAAEGNRGVERAHNEPMGRAFWTAIGNVRWTGRNTGGVGVGNDEYNRDSDYVGGGGNYQTFAVGPIGEKADEYGFMPYIDSKGVRHGRQPSRLSTFSGRW